MQKADSIPSAGTGADSEQKVEDIFVSSNDTKPLVVGSQSHGTLKEFGHFVFDEKGDVCGVAIGYSECIHSNEQ